MLPTIREDDWLMIQAGSPGPGGIIVVRAQTGDLVAHRLLRVVHSDSGAVLLTRGDNRPAVDQPWHEAAVVGQVVRVIRLEGDFCPLSRITLALRIRWAYLTLRHLAGRAVRKLVYRLGSDPSVPS